MVASSPSRSTRNPACGSTSMLTRARLAALGLRLGLARRRLGAGRAAPAAQRDARFGQHAVHEAVRATVCVGELADALALVVCLLQLGSELGAVGAGNPRALLQNGHGFLLRMPAREASLHGPSLSIRSPPF